MDSLKMCQRTHAEPVIATSHWNRQFLCAECREQLQLESKRRNTSNAKHLRPRKGRILENSFRLARQEYPRTVTQAPPMQPLRPHDTRMRDALERTFEQSCRNPKYPSFRP